MKGFLLPPALALLLGAAQTLPPTPGGPGADAPTATAGDAPAEAPPFESWRYNPRERTQQGLEQLEAGDAPGAAASFATAGRLAPTDPVARFNAGTAGLLAGVDGALDHLEFASENAPPELAPAAHFNLGNARLAAGEADGAIEAYKESLRRNPTNRDVKHNLELALAAQQQQQQQEQQQQEQQQQGEQEQDEREQPEPQSGEDGEQDESQQQPGEAPPQEQPRDQKLPDFADQPDMSAEQAAAILEAVENLERDERRRQAAERARKKSKKGKDW